MTWMDLVANLRRWWWLALVGLMVTTFAAYGVHRQSPVYSASNRIYFLVPKSAVRPNQLAPDNGSPIMLAGIIQTELNNGVPRVGPAGPTVTIVDEGIYDGWSVRLPNTGGQWATNFTEPCLQVQVSGPSKDAVVERMNALIERVKALVAAREDAADVAQGSRVTFTLSPPVVAVNGATGYPSRAMAVTAVVGVGLSLAACVVADRIAQRVRRRTR